jgi:hypothetical protein
VALALSTSVTQAAQIVFTFNCIIVNATTCTPTSPLGTLTLTDSIVNPNRVDLDLVILPRDGVGGLKQFYLNHEPLPPGPRFRLVSQNAAPGTFDAVGNSSMGLDNAGPNHTTLDLSLAPITTGALTYSASLLRGRYWYPYGEYNLEVGMFDLKDANGLLYAAFETVSGDTTLYAGARGLIVEEPTPPEPPAPPVTASTLLPPPGFADAPVPAQTPPAVQAINMPEPGTLPLLAIAATFLALALNRTKALMR